jgi:hypothetical protein
MDAFDGTIYFESDFSRNWKDWSLRRKRGQTTDIYISKEEYPTLPLSTEV